MRHLHKAILPVLLALCATAAVRAAGDTPAEIQLQGRAATVEKLTPIRRPHCAGICDSSSTAAMSWSTSSRRWGSAPEGVWPAA